jgi:hypothetical protein
LANAKRCVGYVEYHFIGGDSPAAKYTVVNTGTNASQIINNWGRWYSQEVVRELNIPLGCDQGINISGSTGPVMLQERLMTREKKDRLTTIIGIVNGAQSHNEKVTALRRNIEELGGVVLTVLKALL